MSNKIRNKLKRGKLVFIKHSYEYPELEGTFGIIIGMTELEFDSEDKSELVDVFDVHCENKILQCYEEDLEIIENEKHISYS